MRPNPTRCDAAAALEAAEREEREARAAAADLSREAAEAAVARDRALPQLQHHLGLYPIVTSQYSSTTLFQVYYHIQ